MFVRQEVPVDLGFTAAQARLANLASAGWIDGTSRAAYGDGVDALVRVGPLGDLPGMSKLVCVHFRELVARQDSAVLTLRWEATGAGGALFPVLDADITLTPEGEHATRLAVAGVYRAPFGALGAAVDRAVLRHVAAATAGSLLRRVASALAEPAGQAGTAGRSAVARPRPQTEP
jgi:hypothetical protein